MDTLSHGAWTYLVLHRHPKRWWIIAGAVFPDTYLIGKVLWSILRGDVKISIHWLIHEYSRLRVLEFDSFMHSLVFWGAVFVLAKMLHWGWLQWFAGGVYIHIGIDILTHQKLVPQYLWPLRTTLFKGPMDYTKFSFAAANLAALVLYSTWRIYGRRLYTKTILRKPLLLLSKLKGERSEE